jgi:hypothetical protein
MKTRSACRCLLCHLETYLKQRLDRDGLEYQELSSSSSLLSAFPTVVTLATHLRTCRSAGDGTHPADAILLELLHASDGTPNLARDVLLLAFIPALHSASRQIALRYPHLLADDIAQHLVASLLEVLGSGALLLRSSHLPFVISRMVKRLGFDWAEREARSPSTPEGDAPFPDRSALMDAPEPFERAMLLRHFLFRCLRDGLLTGPDLQLLVDIKLEGKTGQEPGPSIYSNAMRQRIKRLLQKLRHAAHNPRSAGGDQAPPKP